jgi:hypothetical protein
VHAAAVPLSTSPLLMARTSMRQKGSSAIASASTPILACWRTLLTASCSQRRGCALHRRPRRPSPAARSSAHWCLLPASSGQASSHSWLRDPGRTTPHVRRGHAVQRLGLAGIPALALQKARQQLALELRARLLGQPMRQGTTRSRKKLFQPSNSTSTGRSSTGSLLGVPVGRQRIGGQAEPEEAVGRQRQQVGQSPIGGKALRPASPPARGPSRRAGPVPPAAPTRLTGWPRTGCVVLVFAHVGQHLAVARVQHREAAAAEGG